MSGTCQSVFMWWELQMDLDGDIMLSCAPRWAHPEPKQMQVRQKLTTNISLTTPYINVHNSLFYIHLYQRFSFFCKVLIVLKYHKIKLYLYCFFMCKKGCYVRVKEKNQINLF